MEYRERFQIVERAKQIAPVSDGDIEQLIPLLDGVRGSADLLESLIQPFDGEVEIEQLSSTVEGDR